MSTPLLIADSGPLIALARLDLLALPSRYFPEVLVTPTVWSEVHRKPVSGEAERLKLAMDAGYLCLKAEPDMPPRGMPPALTRGGIDAGERSAILLALDLRADLLVDDRRARLAARQLGIRVVGVLGLLERGRKSGVVGPLRPLLERLVASGYFLPDELVQQLLTVLGE